MHISSFPYIIVYRSFPLAFSAVHYNQNLKEVVEALNLVNNNDSVQPVEILLDIFTSDLVEKKSVHIITDRPHSGEL
jgi:hypothetical protein